MNRFTSNSHVAFSVLPAGMSMLPRIPWSNSAAGTRIRAANAAIVLSLAFSKRTWKRFFLSHPAACDVWSFATTRSCASFSSFAFAIAAFRALLLGLRREELLHVCKPVDAPVAVGHLRHVHLQVEGRAAVRRDRDGEVRVLPLPIDLREGACERLLYAEAEARVGGDGAVLHRLDDERLELRRQRSAQDGRERIAVGGVRDERLKEAIEVDVFLELVAVAMLDGTGDRAERVRRRVRPRMPAIAGQAEDGNGDACDDRSRALHGITFPTVSVVSAVLAFSSSSSFTRVWRARALAASHSSSRTRMARSSGYG